MNPNQKSRSNTLLTPDRLTTALFVVYILVLFWILLFKFGVHFSYMESRELNLIPFRGLFLPAGKIDLPEIVLNVIIFIPLGIYGGVLFRKLSIVRNLLIFFLTSLTFEVLQFALAIGTFDSTDLINNTLGGFLGLLMYLVIERIFQNRDRAQKFVNILALTGSVIMIALLVLLKLSMLPVKYQ